MWYYLYKAKKLFKKINSQIKELEKIWLPEDFTRDILESWLLNQKFFNWNLLKRFSALNKVWINYNKMINKVIKEIPKLSRDEALLIFTYTDNTIYENLNKFLRWDKNTLANLTPNNIKASKSLIQKLKIAIKKCLIWIEHLFIDEIIRTVG